MPNFTTGAEEAEQQSKSRSFSGRVPFLVVKEDDKQPTFIRMITDHPQWITVQVHISVPTKPKPDGFTDWPKALSFVCQNDRTFRLRDNDGNLVEPPQWEEGYGHCYVHEHMAAQLDNFKRSRAETATQIYALCVLRKPVRGDGGITGFTDSMVEWKDKDNKVWQVPDFRLITQKWSNFFGPIHASTYMTKSVCVKDYMVQRTGKQDYNIVPAEATPDLKPGTEKWQTRYLEPLKMMGIDLGDIVVGASSPEFYGRFLDPAVKVKPPRGEGGGESDTSSEEAAAPASAPDISPEEIEAFRQQLQENANTGQPADGSP